MRRADLSDRYEMSAGTPLKTFVLEAHAGDDAAAFLGDLAGGSVRLVETDDLHLHRLVGDDVDFVVDHLDDRFWSFHTEAPADNAFPFLKERVEASRSLDWMWLPSGHLRSIWPGSEPEWVRSDFRGHHVLPEGVSVRDLQIELRGRDAGQLVRWIESGDGYRGSISFDRVVVSASEPAFGRVHEAVNRMGRFVAKGDSFELHQEVIRSVVGRYRSFVRQIEDRSLLWSDGSGPGGLTMGGGAISLTFARPVPDLDLLLGEMFSSREPFRLWGAPRFVDDDLAEVEAVDLHVGQELSMDVSREWVRVYLNAGSCGNTIARLVANLQHRVDGALELVDPALEIAASAA